MPAIIRQPGFWRRELADMRAITATLRTTPGWTHFALNATVTLPAGSSQVWLAER